MASEILRSATNKGYSVTGDHRLANAMETQKIAELTENDGTFLKIILSIM